MAVSSLFASLHSGVDVAVRESLDSLPPLTKPQVSRRWGALAAHSLKGRSQAAGLDLAIRTVDLTTLEGADSPGRVQRLVARAVTPDPDNLDCPRPAAVCVYPNLVSVARHALDGRGATGIAVASVAGAFPAGLGPLESRLSEIRQAVSDGADEIDIVLDRSLFLAGKYEQVFDELRQAREAAGPARLKTILETGELGSLENIWRASWLAASAGTDFLKTSTGKSAVGATPEAVWVLATCASRFNSVTGADVGVKISGGVRSAKDALRLMLLVADAAGPAALEPSRFRLGASTLLDDLCAQRRFHRTGSYWGPEYFPLG
jgi:deoxyribose-phosphate aldolase